MKEIIKVNFDNEKDCIKYIDGLTQWDYGLTLEVSGLEIENKTIEVHFSLDETVGEALRSVATVKDNILIVPIPSAILQAENTYNYNAYGFIYLSSATTGKTIKKIVFNVESRPKPADFVAPEDKPDIVGQLIEQLNLKVDKVEGKDLSSNDFTNDDKNKLDALPDANILSGMFSEQDEELERVYKNLDSKIKNTETALNEKIEGNKSSLENKINDLDTKVTQEYAKKGNTLEEYGITDAATKKDLDNTKEALQKNIDSNTEEITEIKKNISGLDEKIIAANENLENLSNEFNETTANSKNNFANAVKATASGEVIRVDDISPLEHTVKAKVGRKRNIIPFPYYSKSRTTNGVTITVNTDGTIVLNGTCTGAAVGFALFVGSIPLKGKYTLSGVTNTGETSHYLQPYIDGNFQASVANNSKTYEFNGNLTQISLFIKSGYTFDNVVVYPQFEIGDTATEYEPYINPESVTVTGCGKNLFNDNDYTLAIANTDINERNGNKFTLRGLVGNNIMAYSAGAMRVLLKQGVKNKDKITVSLYITLLEQGTYDNRIRLWSLGKDAVTQEQRDFNLTVNKRTKIVATYDTPKTDILNGITFYLNNNKALIELDTMQVEIGDTATEYEPYKGKTYIPAADGSVNILSVAPTMTLLTDTEGINIEAEYNQDTNKAFGNVNNDLKELDRVTTKLIEDMGNVETALDSIIAIQNELIGGETV